MPWIEVIMNDELRRRRRVGRIQGVRSGATTRRRRRRIRRALASCQSQYVLHVVDARLLPDDPLGGAQGAAGKDAAVAGLVREFQAFAQGSKHHGVVADNVAAAQGMDAHLG